MLVHGCLHDGLADRQRAPPMMSASDGVVGLGFLLDGNDGGLRGSYGVAMMLCLVVLMWRWSSGDGSGMEMVVDKELLAISK